MLSRVRRHIANLSCLALAAGVVCATAPARADITMSMHMGIDMPALNKMPAKSRAAMDRLLNSTIYIHGKKFRYDNTLVSVIVDRQAGTMTTANKMSKTFSVTPFDPGVARMMMPGGSLSSTGPLKGYKLADEGDAGAYLGHKVRRYLLTEQVALPNAGLETIRATVLSAQDIAPADMASYASLSSSMPGTIHMKGFPLKMNMAMTGGSMGTMTLAMQATSISTSSIPDSVFEVPMGYTEANSPPVGPQAIAPQPGGSAPENNAPTNPAPSGPPSTGAPTGSGNSGTGGGGAAGSPGPGSGGTTGGSGSAPGGGTVPNRGAPVPPPPPI